jgi:hypothetical protein
VACRADDPRAARRQHGRGRGWFARGLTGLLICAAATALPAAAQDLRAPDQLRIATYNAALSRDGPGLLLRDILRGDDAQIAAVADVIAHVAPDILLLTAIDHDGTLAALHAFAAELAARGASYPHRFAFAPNAGQPSGLDLDGDGRTGTPDDAHGHGDFAGAKGMAILSRLPIDPDEARDFSGFPWRDLPGALYPADGAPEPEQAQAVQRLSSTGHWDVPVVLPDGARLHLLAFYASPPVFGGPGARNLRRNHDEVRFWQLFLDGALPMAPPDAPVVLLGDSNLDPLDGDGRGAAMAALLSHPALRDPAPRSAGGPLATGPRDAGHRGDPGLDTVHWPQANGPGNLRVDYVLPDARLRVVDAGVFWPGPDTPEAALLGTGEAAASRHRLVWVDIALPLAGP